MDINTKLVSEKIANFVEPDMTLQKFDRVRLAGMASCTSYIPFGYLNFRVVPMCVYRSDFFRSLGKV